MKKLNQGANKITPLQKKRGSAESWMVYTGIILIVLVIFGIFIKDWGLNMKKEQRIQQCKRSVDFRNIGDQIEFIENQIESPSSAINTAIRITTGVVAYTVTAVVAGAIITVSGGTATPLVIMGIGALAGGTSAIFLAPTADDLLIGSPEDVELKCVTESNKINSRDKQEILNEISEEMYICYNMFGLGKYDNIFGPNGKRYCFIC
ncbi:MAG: hypothetical protein KAQ83_04660, partial [Nanoarchaeota archaeon]|nr:hypothetical protein [Nanoarchaeota archaeon]